MILSRSITAFGSYKGISQQHNCKVIQQWNDLKSDCINKNKPDMGTKGYRDIISYPGTMKVI